MNKNEKKHENCFMRETCLKDDICPMVLAYKLLSGKRKIMILWFLSNKILRFNEIQKKMPDVTQKMLTKQLRSLEEDHLIYRHVYPTVPPKVEYEITEVGSRIIPILELMHQFGASYIETFRDQIDERYNRKENGEICT